MSRAKTNGSIALRLLGLVLGMFLLLLLISIATSLFGLTQFEERATAIELGEEEQLFTQSLKNQQEHLLFTALALAEDPSLLDAVRATDRERIQRLALALQVRYQLDHMKLAGSSGQVFLHTGPSSDATQAALRRALLTIEQTAVDLVPEGVLLLAAVPLRDGDGIKGALVVGQLLDDRLLRSINFERDENPLVFLHTADGTPLASSRPGGLAAGALEPPDVTVWQRATQEHVIATAHQGRGERYQVLYAPLIPGAPDTPIYSIALSTSLFQALRLAIVQQNMIILVAVALVTTTVMITAIRSLIVQPLNDLDQAAARVGAGELNLELASERQDEIGRLTNSFGAMTARLRALFTALDARNHELEEERAHIDEARLKLQTEVEQAQRTILNMVMPRIPIDRQTIIMPLIGSLDEVRATQVLAGLLESVEQQRARVAIIDITGVPVVDLAVAEILHRAVLGVRLLGAQVLITGIQPEVAESLVGVGIDLEGLRTYATLEQAISAVRRQGDT